MLAGSSPARSRLGEELTGIALEATALIGSGAEAGVNQYRMLRSLEQIGAQATDKLTIVIEIISIELSVRRGGCWEYGCWIEENVSIGQISYANVAWCNRAIGCCFDH
ncbi:hypothetical protein KSC_027140 [Ktedonobacter sp. SOSP1-52]|nr:hypothetical protein KSC_027140 [Ktedonobacter sp. SOSP1-52]